MCLTRPRSITQAGHFFGCIGQMLPAAMGAVVASNYTPLCIRVLMHIYTDKARNELHHIYLEGAKGLRDDLPE